MRKWRPDVRDSRLTLARRFRYAIRRSTDEVISMRVRDAAFQPSKSPQRSVFFQPEASDQRRAFRGNFSFFDVGVALVLFLPFCYRYRDFCAPTIVFVLPFV